MENDFACYPAGRDVIILRRKRHRQSPDRKFILINQR
jgi:hypothetical protein